MSSTTLKSEINEKCRKDGVLLQKIAETSKRHFGTVQKWFYNNHPNLNRIEHLEIIANHFGLSVSEIIETAELTPAENAK